jgi:hypothetical protein
MKEETKKRFEDNLTHITPAEFEAHVNFLPFLS